MFKRLVTAGIEALALTLAALACSYCAWRLDPQPSAAILAIVLSVSLGRSQIDRDLKGRIEAAFVLPAVAVACMGIGWLLHNAPVWGAIAYMAGMALSVWIRRFGPRARPVGGLIALPFVTLLAVPVHPPASGLTLSLLHKTAHLPPVTLPILTGWLALFWAGLAHAFLHRFIRHGDRVEITRQTHGRYASRAISATRETSPIAAATSERPPNATPFDAVRQMLPSTRMALQMTIALGAAFAAGDLLLQEHWAWIVLTALIVNLGNRGRLDVLYKGIQRLGGAAAGTVIAFIATYAISVTQPHPAHSNANAAVALLALFVAIWLRPFGYAWWALCITIALALLQGLAPLASLHLLETRLIAIAAGAAIGVASAWWAWPIDSTHVVRRRLADALARLGEAFGHPQHSAGDARQTTADLAFELRESWTAVAEVAPAFHAARRLMRWMTRLPIRRAAGFGQTMLGYLEALSIDADRIDALIRCQAPAHRLIALGENAPTVRRAVGAARKTLCDRQANLAALNELAEQLERLDRQSYPPAPTHHIQDDAWTT